jgi:hypothetical protein
MCKEKSEVQITCHIHRFKCHDDIILFPIGLLMHFMNQLLKMKRNWQVFFILSHS